VFRQVKLHGIHLVIDGFVSVKQRVVRYLTLIP